VSANNPPRVPWGEGEGGGRREGRKEGRKEGRNKSFPLATRRPPYPTSRMKRNSRGRVSVHTYARARVQAPRLHVCAGVQDASQDAAQRLGAWINRDRIPRGVSIVTRAAISNNVAGEEENRGRRSREQAGEARRGEARRGERFLSDPVQCREPRVHKTRAGLCARVGVRSTRRDRVDAADGRIYPKKLAGGS